MVVTPQSIDLISLSLKYESVNINFECVKRNLFWKCDVADCHFFSDEWVNIFIVNHTDLPFYLVISMTKETQILWEIMLYLKIISGGSIVTAGHDSQLICIFTKPMMFIIVFKLIS